MKRLHVYGPAICCCITAARPSCRAFSKADMALTVEAGDRLKASPHDSLRLAGSAKRALRLVNGTIQPNGQTGPASVEVPAVAENKALSSAEPEI